MPDLRVPVDRHGFSPQIAGVIREARQLLGWSQRELADRAKTSHTTIWRIEGGHPAELDLLVVERLFAALGIRATLSLDARHLADRRRQADAVHARVNGYVGCRLRRHSFLVATEVMLGDGAPRGWIDTLAFRPADRSLLVEETKTEFDDLGALQRTVAFYEREALAAARSLGWAPRRVAVLVAALDTAQVARRLVDSREAAGTAFPESPVATLEWLRDANATPPRGWTLGIVDPASRRETWLLPSSLISRRRPSYSDYADAARSLLRR